MQNWITLLDPFIIRIDLAKNEIWLKQDEVCKAIAWVQSGALYSYYSSEEGEKQILDLYVPNQWVSSYRSFFNSNSF